MLRAAAIAALPCPGRTASSSRITFRESCDASPISQVGLSFKRSLLNRPGGAVLEEEEVEPVRDRTTTGLRQRVVLRLSEHQRTDDGPGRGERADNPPAPAHELGTSRYFPQPLMP